MSSGTRMTTAEYAVHRKVSDSFVRRLRREGKLVCDGREILVEESDQRLANITDPVRGGDRSAGAGAGDAARSRESSSETQEAIRRERMARARLAELELGQAAGELTRVDGVRRAVFTLGRAALNELLGLKGRLRGRLAKAVTPEDVDRILDDEVNGIAKRMRDAALALNVELE